jgi:hypothetical protein
MAASLLIEEERGVYTGFLHDHNGYYAGAFTAVADATSSKSPNALAEVHQLASLTNPAMRAAA